MAAGGITGRLTAFWNHPAGPKTIFFWCVPAELLPDCRHGWHVRCSWLLVDSRRLCAGHRLSSGAYLLLTSTTSASRLRTSRIRSKSVCLWVTELMEM